MSLWREQKNERARYRLERALPAVFPGAVLAHAYGRALTPPLPRLSVESYWQAHPLRADRLARSLAARSGSPSGWSWSLSPGEDSLPRNFRAPPTPYREAAYRPGPGYCRICAQPVYRFGWHLDLWRDGRANERAQWHGCCVAAWKLWNAPHRHAGLIRRLQRRRCLSTGKRLLRSAEVDHITPLFMVWRDRRATPWPDLLRFWGFPNLQCINRDAHVAKCLTEASVRANTRQICSL